MGCQSNKNMFVENTRVGLFLIEKNFDPNIVPEHDDICKGQDIQFKESLWVFLEARNN